MRVKDEKCRASLIWLTDVLYPLLGIWAIYNALAYQRCLNTVKDFDPLLHAGFQSLRTCVFKKELELE